MKLNRPAVLLLACSLPACSGEDPPPAFAHLHEDAFLVAHIDVDAVRDSGVFKRLLELDDFRDGWMEMQSDFAREMGFEMSALRELTFSGFETAEGRPGVLLYLLGNDAADAARLGVPQSVARGDYETGTLSTTLDADGEYWLEVEAYDADYDRIEFEGELRGAGPLAEAFAAARVDPRTGYVGPVEADAGASLDITAQWEQSSTLELLRSATPTRIAEREVYPNGYAGFLAHLDQGLVVMGDELVSWSERKDEGPWRAAVADALDPGEPDGELFDALKELPSSRTMIAACAWSALPREMRSDLVEGLGQVLTAREAQALHEIETIALEARLDDALAWRAAIVCEDEEGAEEVLALLEDILDLAEAIRELPREAEEVIEAIRVERKGLTVRLELDLEAEQVDGLVEALKTL